MINSIKPKLIILRGSAAVGKTTISIALKQRLLCEGKKVALFHWDDFCHFISPISMTTNGIIQSSQALIKSLFQFYKQDSSLFFIIDGVFILPEEHQIIQSLESQFEIHSFLLKCDEETQFFRNKNRNTEDFLEESRIFELNKSINNDKIFSSEIILNTSLNSVNEICNNIFELFSLTTDSFHFPNLKSDYEFIHSSLWNLGQIVRLHGQIWNKIDRDIFLYNVEQKSLRCLTPFYPDFGICSIDESIKKIFMTFLNPVEKIEFQYIDNSHPLFEKAINSKIKNSQIASSYSLKIEDRWKAPILKLNGSQEIIYNSRLLRTLRKDLDNSENEIKYINVLGINNRIKVWEKILLLDINSWKGRQNSDMSQLNREDICYLPSILCDESNCSLYLAERQQEILAWSLFIRSSHDCSWFAVKWGASENGREYFAGIKLLNHQIKELREKSIEDFGESKYFKVDFWGRNSEVYNQFANHYEDRGHLVLDLKCCI